MPYSFILTNKKNYYERFTYNTHMRNPSVTCLDRNIGMSQMDCACTWFHQYLNWKFLNLFCIISMEDPESLLFNLYGISGISYVLSLWKILNLLCIISITDLESLMYEWSLWKIWNLFRLISMEVPTSLMYISMKVPESLMFNLYESSYISYVYLYESSWISYVSSYISYV